MSGIPDDKAVPQMPIATAPVGAAPANPPAVPQGAPAAAPARNPYVDAALAIGGMNKPNTTALPVADTRSKQTSAAKAFNAGAGLGGK